MRQLLVLVFYIFAAVGLAWLVIWGAAQVGFPSVPGMILAGLVFVAVLIYGFSRSGMVDV